MAMTTLHNMLEAGMKAPYFRPVARAFPFVPEDAFLKSGNTETIVEFWDEIEWD